MPPHGSRNERPLSPFPLPPQPSELTGFPRHSLRGAQLYRIHRAGRTPWWFSNDGSGRFDLPTAGGQGTCYLAETPAGCFLEVFRAWTLVPAAEVEVRRLSHLPMPEKDLADCTSPKCREFGLTAEIHSTPDYVATQRWAAALAAAGFGGIRYLLRHDPSADSVGVALFGTAGDSLAHLSSYGERIGQEVLDEVEARFGIRVRPTP